MIQLLRTAWRQHLAAAAAVLVGFGVPAPMAGTEFTELYLSEGRFRVSAEWATPHGGVGSGRAVPLTGESGYFWFFDQGNVEIFVKVLDACVAPFDRFWVFAAGLTNVDVTLTVEDTHAADTAVYRNPQGTPFQPIQDTGTFATCGVSRACGKGTAGEIAASPRADELAERAALALGGTLTASEALYQRAAADLAAILAAYPELPTSDVTYVTREAADHIALVFDEATHQEVLAGAYTAWSCLDEWYGATGKTFWTLPGGASAVLVSFDGRFDLRHLAEDYGALPGVVGAEPFRLAGPSWPVVPPLPTGLCARASGGSAHYFFFPYHPSTLEVGEPGTTWYFTSEPDEVPVLAGTHTAPEPHPTWWPALLACHGGG